MALYGMVFLGSTPFGGGHDRLLAQRYGPRAGFIVGGVAAVGAGIRALWLRSRAAASPPPETIRVSEEIAGPLSA